jgi:hypothetical protein
MQRMSSAPGTASQLCSTVSRRQLRRYMLDLADAQIQCPYSPWRYRGLSPRVLGAGGTIEELEEAAASHFSKVIWHGGRIGRLLETFPGMGRLRLGVRNLSHHQAIRSGILRA